MKNQFNTASLVRFAGALALTASLASAGITNQIYNYSYSTNPAAVRSSYVHYVDWSTTGGHKAYNTMAFNGDNVRYFEYTTYAFTGFSRCYTLATSNTTPAGGNADTEILIKNSSGVWVKLADDVRGTYAEANIWITGGGNTRSNPKIRVNAYSASHHDEAFMFENKWFTDNYVGCVDGIAALPGSVSPAAAVIDQYGNASTYRVK
jgi:hypothetical protein